MCRGAKARNILELPWKLFFATVGTHFQCHRQPLSASIRTSVLHYDKGKQWAHGGNDFIIPHHAKAAVPAGAFAILVCDAPSRAEQPSRRHPHCVCWAACISLNTSIGVYLLNPPRCLPSPPYSLSIVCQSLLGCQSPVQPSYSHCLKCQGRASLQGCHSHWHMVCQLLTHLSRLTIYPDRMV